jgi:recombination protein RecT
MNQQVTKQQEKPLVTVKRYFEQHRAQIEAALPKHLTPDRMVRLATTALSQNRKLADCSATSIFASVIVASQLGLEIGVAGQGFLVPYKTTATFIPGWQGLVDLVSRSGRGSVWTGAVFEGDQFDYVLGDSPSLTHRPGGENDPARMTHVYAIGRPKGAEWPIIEVWPIARIWKHRDKNNKVGNDHYSFKHPEMYARKIPLLQVLKYMPKSIELTAAVELSHRVDEGRRASIDANFVIIDEPEDQDAPKPPTAALTSTVRSRKAAAAPPADAPVDTATGEIMSQPATAIADLLLDVSQATTLDELDFVRSLAAAIDSLSDADNETLKKAIAARAAELAKEGTE